MAIARTSGRCSRRALVNAVWPPLKRCESVTSSERLLPRCLAVVRASPHRRPTCAASSGLYRRSEHTSTSANGRASWLKRSKVCVSTLARPAFSAP
eukprot:scaffold77509_cov75-Phaeocystis_antarctica.AAC.3